MTGIYYAAAESVWTVVDKIGALELLAVQRERIAELERLVVLLEFERDQAYGVIRSLRC